VKNARSAGFTMVEAMFVILIMSILAVIGIPAMRDLIVSTRVKAAASDAFATLIFARSEAIKRNAAVDVIPVDATNWALGWKVRPVGTTSDLQVTDAVTGNITVTGPGATVRYRGDGRLVDAGTGALLTADTAFTFYTTEYAYVPMRCVSIAPSGRPAVRLDKDQDRTNGC
jgi:type IV fimbrial biogenesis protein FimT